MNKIPRILVCLGTRPEAIKLAPVVAQFRNHLPEENIRVVFTGQHREILEQATGFLGLKPDVNLEVMEAGQSLNRGLSKIVSSLDGLLEREEPDLVIVQGDTTTVFGASIASAYRRIPVAHVEAGLRTNDRFHPFPEEINRRLVSIVAAMHFAPTENAKTNLLAEGVNEKSIEVTGNTAIDAVLAASKHPVALPFALNENVPVVTTTLHRRESFGKPLRDILSALRIVAEELDAQVVYPVHPNPQVRSAAKEILQGVNRVHLVEPLSYEPFVSLLKQSTLVLTDSGGIQEEAPALNVPVLVAREVTERPEGVASGVAKLVGTQQENIVNTIRALLKDGPARSAMMQAKNPYGDGRASERIVTTCLTYCQKSNS